MPYLGQRSALQVVFRGPLPTSPATALCTEREAHKARGAFIELRLPLVAKQKQYLTAPCFRMLEDVALYVSLSATTRL